MRSRQRLVLPPFSRFCFDTPPGDFLASVRGNPHPTDLLLDTSVFSTTRIPLVREILGCLSSLSPILLAPVVKELEDLKRKPALAELRDIVFPDGVLNVKFRGDHCGVFKSYPRFTTRYASLLRWRRELIDRPARHIELETGSKPAGRSRAKLIRELIEQGLATETIKLANKVYRADRSADEVLAVFAVLSPITTGRDCFLFTADEDVFEQTLRMSEMLFDDYGAYLMAEDFRADELRHRHRHTYTSPLFVGEAEAVGRSAHPDYLLPPPGLVMTCSTTVIDVGRRKGFTWISARNMEAAIAFQEHDTLGRKGNPGMGRSIVFTPPRIPGFPFRCNERHHFVLGTPLLLKLKGDDVGPMAFFDLARAALRKVEAPTRLSRVITPFADFQRRLEERLRIKQRR